MNQADTLKQKLSQYRQYLADDQSNPQILAVLADLHMKLGEMDNALDRITEAVAADPENTNLMFQKATIQLAAKQYEDAIALYEQIRQQSGGGDGAGDEVLNYNLAYAYLYNGDYQQAKQLFGSVLGHNDALPQAPFLYAKTLHHLGDLDAAIASLEHFLGDNPDDHHALGRMALVHVDAGKNEQALHWATRALEINENNHEALLTLGTIALEEGKPEQADRLLKSAIRIAPTSGRSWSALGMTQMFSEQLEQATFSLEQAVEYMPNHIGTWHALAWCRLMANDVAGAEMCFNEAMHIDRNFAENHGGVGLIAFIKGDKDEAKLCMNRALKLDNQCFGGRYLQSMFEQDKGNSERAGAIINALISALVNDSSLKLNYMLKRYVKDQQPMNDM